MKAGEIEESGPEQLIIGVRAIEKAGEDVEASQKVALIKAKAKGKLIVFKKKINKSRYKQLGKLTCQAGEL